MELKITDIKPVSVPFKFPERVHVLKTVYKDWPCGSEDDHTFNSMGQCSKCGSHRTPAR